MTKLLPTLPLFVTRKNKFIAGALMFAISYTIYYILNHNPVFEPQYLTMTWVDLNVPLVPWTILVYTSEYVYFVYIYFTLRNYDNINRYLYAYFFLQMAGSLVFLFYPVTYPRENYPIPADIPAYLKAMWTWLHQQDAPTNCLPSLHVASVYLSSFAMLAEKRIGHFWFALTWSTAVAVTTLTTKQHYLVDIIAGIGFAAFFYWWFYHKQKYLRVWPKDQGIPQPSR